MTGLQRLFLGSVAALGGCIAVLAWSAHLEAGWIETPAISTSFVSGPNGECLATVEFSTRDGTRTKQLHCRPHFCRPKPPPVAPITVHYDPADPTDAYSIQLAGIVDGPTPGPAGFGYPFLLIALLLVPAVGALCVAVVVETALRHHRRSTMAR